MSDRGPKNSIDRLLIRLYRDSGLSLDKCAERMPFSKEKCRYKLLEMGIKLRGRHEVNTKALEARNRQIFADRAGGLSQRKLAAKYGLARDTIRRILKSCGGDPLQRKAPAPSPSGEQVAWLSESYSNGNTLRDLADLSGISRECIRQCLISAGVRLRPRGFPRGRYRHADIRSIV